MFPLVQFVSELAQGTDAVTRSEFNIQPVDRAGDQHLMIRMSTSGLPIDESLLETVNDFFGSADVTAQERGIAIAGVKSLMDSMSGSLHLASTEAGFEVVLEAPLTQLKRRQATPTRSFGCSGSRAVWGRFSLLRRLEDETCVLIGSKSPRQHWQHRQH